MENNELLKHVQHIANSLTNPEEPIENEYGNIEGDAFHWLEDALDIEWIVSNDKKSLLGARVLVAFGGPNIWVDTRKKIVEGFWWGAYAKAEFEDNLDLADALETLYHC
jgi:hypothetical protein